MVRSSFCASTALFALLSPSPGFAQDQLKSVSRVLREAAVQCRAKSKTTQHGTLAFSYIVAPDGSVSSVGVIKDTLRDAATKDCMVAQFTTLKFVSATGTNTFEPADWSWTF